MIHTYLFEAKGIQSYILESGKLIDLIGGSDVIAGLCSSNGDDLLEMVLHATDARDILISRRSGAAFCLHCDNPGQLNRIRALWRVVVMTRFPGLSFTDTDPSLVAATNFSESLKLAYRSQSGVRENSAAMLRPSGHGMTSFVAASGRLAVASDFGGTKEDLDAVLAPQRARGRKIARSNVHDRLARCFLPTDSAAQQNYIFPRQFEIADANLNNPAFPIYGKDRRVGVVHADISGLGQLFREISAQATRPETVFEIATQIENAIVESARAASEAIILPAALEASDKNYGRHIGETDRHFSEGPSIVPARPILLGGDDITIIVRADLAIPFTECLLKQIEAKTRTMFEKMAAGRLTQNLSAVTLPSALSACAGIALVGSGDPFLMAERFAGGLCTSAKQIAKAVDRPNPHDAFPSALSFSVITSSTGIDYEDYRNNEEKVPDGPVLNGGPYVLGGKAVGSMRSLDGLFMLARSLAPAPGRGKLRQSLGDRFESYDKAKKSYDRFFETCSQSDPLYADTIREELLRLSDTGESIELDAVLPHISDALELLDIGALDSWSQVGSAAGEAA